MRIPLNFDYDLLHGQRLASITGCGANPDNWALYDVNTIANYDPTIIPYLDSPVGSAFGRDADGVWRAEPMPTDLPTD
jgi:Protein of unknown function (DUF2185)